ncbi:EamA family transporter [Verminephrobacter aporrectodeae]|uniref:EamA family transporter n=1 Tax=Verminephrobacter aporrectodeae TaxID=1110389 RepID=UPI0002377ADF|nr:EamA family transporter [Verminephrobacter aporrectodeae]
MSRGPPRVSWVDLLLTAIAPIVWGSTYLVTTELLPADRPLLAAVMRALPAGLLLVALGGRLPRGAWWWRMAVLGVLNIGAFFYLLFVAAYHLPGGVAALILSSQPVIVLILGTLLLGRAFVPVQLLACVLAVAGVGLVALQPGARFDGVGIAAGGAGALSMALGLVLSKRWGRPSGVGVMTYTGWQLGIGGAVLLPVMLLGEGLPAGLSAANWMGFGYLSVIGALLAYALWFRGIERMPALSLSFLSLLSPLSAALLGFVYLGQGLGPTQLLGAACVVGAVVLAQARDAATAASDPSS